MTPQVTPQVERARRLLLALRGNMRRAELMRAMGLEDRMHFVAEYLQPELPPDAEGALT